MDEYETIEYALVTIRRLRMLIENAYELHDHDSDILGGALLSSAKLFSKAVEEFLISVKLHLYERKK